MTGLGDTKKNGMTSLILHTVTNINTKLIDNTWLSHLEILYGRKWWRMIRMQSF